MSYCRFGKDSDVYLLSIIDGDYECCGCRLTSTINDTDMHDNVQLQEIEDCLKHLDDHVKAGHKVPIRSFERLRQELNNST